MKRALLSLAMVAALPASAAFAADMPVRYKAPPPAPAPVFYNWTGFYVGGHVGYASSDKDWSATAPAAIIPDTASFTTDGFIGGGQLGFNWQSGQWVFGIEGDISWSDQSGSGGQSRFAPTWVSGTDVNWIATLTGRVGWAWDRALVYVKGGFAWIDEDHWQSFLGTTTSVVGNTRGGWTVGVGVEYAFWNNWSAKLEYNYMDFGSDNYGFVHSAPSPRAADAWDIDQSVHAVKFGINYRFGWMPPTVARY